MKIEPRFSEKSERRHSLYLSSEIIFTFPEVKGYSIGERVCIWRDKPVGSFGIIVIYQPAKP